MELQLNYVQYCNLRHSRLTRGVVERTRAVSTDDSGKDQIPDKRQAYPCSLGNSSSFGSSRVYRVQYLLFPVSPSEATASQVVIVAWLFVDYALLCGPARYTEFEKLVEIVKNQIDSFQEQWKIWLGCVLT